MIFPLLFFSVAFATSCPVVSEPHAVPEPEIFESEVRKACKTLSEPMGTYSKKDDKGTIRVSGECLEGEPNRTWRLFGPKGDLLFDWNFKKGDRDGTQVSCAVDGTRSETIYREGVRHGVTRLFDANGENVGELVFVEDDLAWARLVKSGPGWKEVQIGRGEPTRMTRFENGVKIWDRVVLSDGKLHEIRWFPDGKKQSEGDLPDGPRVTWNKSGEVASSQSGALPRCAEGAKVKCLGFGASGRPETIQNFEKGKAAGFLAWDTGVDETGTFWREERLHDAHSDLAKQVRYEDGIEVLEKIRNGGRKNRMRVTKWHRTGVRAAQGLMDAAGEREEGVWVYWDELGRRIATKKFKRGIVIEAKQPKALGGKATASP